MAFGKKKGPPPPKTRQARQAERRSSDHLPVRLNMNEVSFFAQTIARARGYPEDALEDIAWRIVWLEERGLPGLTYFMAELKDFDHVPLKQRGEITNEPIMGFKDPIIAGTYMRGIFSELILGDQTQIRCMNGPSRGFLVLPKLAQLASEASIPLYVCFTRDQGTRIAAVAVLHDNKIAVSGELQDIVDAEGIGVSRYTRELPEHFQVNQTHTLVSKPTMETVVLYGKNSLEPRPSVPAPVITGSPWEKIVKNDSHLLSLFLKLSKGDISILRGACKIPDQSHISTVEGTVNDQIYVYMISLGWLELVEIQELGPIEMKVFCLTPSGREAVPVMLNAFVPKDMAFSDEYYVIG